MTDTVSSIFDRTHIKINIDIGSKEQGLKYLAATAKGAGVALDAEGAYTGLLEREKEFTTGFGDGLAVPHTKSSSIAKPGVFILKPKVPVEWNALDGQPVSVIIGLLTPAEQSGMVHLKLLTSLSRKLIDEEFKKKLMASYDEAELLHMVSEALTAFHSA